jgi:hypothetical protein
VVFTGALQSGHEDDRGRLGGELEARGVGAEGGDELVADDLDDLLGWRQGCSDCCSEGLGADLLDEIAGDLEVDVGFEQGDADLAQSFVDVLVGEGALAAEGLEGALQFFGEVLKHS